MRILFVSGVEGGSFRSTLELARALERRGHEVLCLVTAEGHEREKLVYKRLVNLRTKLGDTGVAARIVGRLARAVGGRREARTGGSPAVMTAPVIENAVSRLLSVPGTDVVVAASLERVAWRAVLA